MFSEPRTTQSIEAELEQLMERSRQEQKFKFPKEVEDLLFFQNFPMAVSRLMEQGYNNAGLSESMAYDSPLKNLISDDGERIRYSPRRLELTQREFLQVMYQAAVEAGYTREWLQEMYERARQSLLSEQQQTEYREALKKIYLILRQQGFCHEDIVG